MNFLSSVFQNMRMHLIWPVIVAVVVVSAVIASFFFSKKSIVKRKLKKAVVKKISDFIDGDVAKIIGTIELVDEPLLAPLSGRPCAFYHIHIEQNVSNAKSSSWRTLIKKEASCKFLVRDGYRFAFITDQRVKKHIVQDKHFSSGFLNDANENLEKYLAAHGHKSTNLIGLNRTIRYREGILEKGEQVAVYGRGAWKKAAVLGLPDSYDRVLALSAPDKGYVYLSDDTATVKNKAPEY